MSNPATPLPYKDVSTGLMQLMEAVRKDTDTLTIAELASRARAKELAGRYMPGGKIPPATYTLSMEECRAIQSGHPVTVPIATDTLKSIRDGLLAVVAQIEAEEKAKPVMNAIQATHNAFRSDGRPHFYDDPLRRKE